MYYKEKCKQNFSEANMPMTLSSITEIFRCMLKTVNPFNLSSGVEFLKYVLSRFSEKNDLLDSHDVTKSTRICNKL